MAKFFIERPILANVIAILTMLMGGVALFFLPVAQYPAITPPTVQVTAHYPGASAHTLVNTVALPIEQQVNGVSGMLYMQSNSASDGSYNLVVTFAVGTDPDQAQVLVQNRVSAALATLPQPVQQQGVTVQKKSTAILQIVTLTAPDARYDSLFLSNYAIIHVRDVLERLPGVANVNIFGAGQYAMRIWLDPEKMSARSLTPSDIVTAIRQQSQEVAAGQVGMPPTPTSQDFQLTVSVPAAMARAEEFSDIIIKHDEQTGGITRLRDVGRAELGAQTYSQSFLQDGKPAAGVSIFQQPEANALEVAKGVRAAMADLSRDFPEGLDYGIPFDTTRFVTASIDEVYTTLIAAGGLVLVVILVFLGNLRATLVPATTVPVTIIGTFAGMALLGFSVNLLTLFAIVLAVGIVVDDAIVVVEGVTRHMERGKSPKQAAIDAMGELFGPIVGITLVLMAVFLPAALLPGIQGQMYRQFALVIAVAAAISAVNAATLKPTQCALWLKPIDPHARKLLLFRLFDRGFGALERGYAGIIGRLVGRPRLTLLAGLVLVGVAGYGLTRVPSGFIPTEDQGYVLVAVQLPDGASLPRTEAVMDRVLRVVQATPGVDHALTISGISALANNTTLANAGVMYVVLKDWSLRTPHTEQGLRAIYMHLQGELDLIQEARSIVIVPPPINGLGLSGGFNLAIQQTDGRFDYAGLDQGARATVAAIQEQPGIARAFNPFSAATPQVRVSIDRTKVENTGLTMGSTLSTLQSYLGSSFVSQITLFGHTFPVYVQGDAPFRATPEDIAHYDVRNAQGKLVPLGTVADIGSEVGPSLITLYNLFPSAMVTGAAAPGTSSGQALDLVTKVAADTLPAGTRIAWTGMSYQELLVGHSFYLVFALSLLLVYLVLAALYENIYAPAAVILAVPLVLLGTVGALLATGLANNVYTQIGLVLLISLSAKNAILIVEMACAEREKHGASLAQAALNAARSRFRPILMTSFAFILGALPLVLATGAGAAARVSIGIAVVSGMLTSTCLAVLFVPSYFVIAQGWCERRRAARLSRSAVPEGSAE